MAMSSNELRTGWYLRVMPQPVKREFKRTQATPTKREVGCYFEGLMRGRPFMRRANVPYTIIPEAFVQSRPDTCRIPRSELTNDKTKCTACYTM